MVVIVLGGGCLVLWYFGSILFPYRIASLRAISSSSASASVTLSDFNLFPNFSF